MTETKSNILELVFNDKQYIANLIRDKSVEKGVLLLVDAQGNYMPMAFGEFSKFEVMGICQAISNSAFLNLL